MAAPRNEELLEQILELARQYALRRWGVTPVYLKLELPDGREQVEIVPQVPVVPAAIPSSRSDAAAPIAPAAAPIAPAAPPIAPAAPPIAPPVDAPWHSEDFSEVRWPGLGEFHFGAKQALVVAALWQARESGEHDRDQDELLELSDSECAKLAELFKRHPAWGVLIVRGPVRPGSYRLAG